MINLPAQLGPGCRGSEQMCCTAASRHCRSPELIGKLCTPPGRKTLLERGVGVQQNRNRKESREGSSHYVVLVVVLETDNITGDVTISRSHKQLITCAIKCRRCAVGPVRQCLHLVFCLSVPFSHFSIRETKMFPLATFTLPLDLYK